MKLPLVILLSLIILTLFSVQIVQVIRLDAECLGYLKRAADANNTVTAKKELDIAIKYLEDKKLTSGYTSILYKTPDDDIGFWYNNLKESSKELSNVENSTSLEKSNSLMKLRETLMDGNQLTSPDGLSRYPENNTWAFINFVSILLISFGVVYLLFKYN